MPARHVATLGEQARQAFENLRRVLEAGGSRMDRVVSTTVLVADISQFGVVNALFAEYFAASPPARIDDAGSAAEGVAVFDWVRGGGGVGVSCGHPAICRLLMAFGRARRLYLPHEGFKPLHSRYA